MAILSIEATPVFEDFRRAFARPARRRIFYHTWPAAFACLVAVVTLAADMERFGLIVISLTLGCQLVYTCVELATVMRRGFDESRAWKLTYRFEFDDAGVSIITRHSQIRYEWSAILRWTEGTVFVSLYARDGQYTYIPRRDLSATDLDRLRDLLTEKIVPNSIAGRDSM